MKTVTMPVRIKRAKKKLWELCKQFVRGKYGGKCYTCSNCNLEGSSQHTGHGIPSASGGALARYHPHNLRVQCYNCNINLGGNGAEYYRNLILEIGKNKVDKLYFLKTKSIKADIIFYENMIALYEAGNEKNIINYLESLI